MAALVFKVGALAVKTLAKPLGERFQRWVMSHPTARQQIVRAAQGMHRLEVYITRGAEGKTGRAFIGNMTEEKSMELASKIASEGFIFTVGVLIVAFEYDRTRRKEVARKKQEAQEKFELIDKARMERETLLQQNEQLQQFALELMSRVELLEATLKGFQEELHQGQSSKQGWGGFFAPLGLSRS